MNEEAIYNYLVTTGASVPEDQFGSFYNSSLAWAKSKGLDLNDFNNAVARYYTYRGFQGPDVVGFMRDDASGKVTFNPAAVSPSDTTFGLMTGKRVGQPDYSGGQKTEEDGDKKTEEDGTPISVIPPMLTLADIQVAGRPLMTAEERAQYLPKKEFRWWEIQQKPAYSPTPGPFLPEGAFKPLPTPQLPTDTGGGNGGNNDNNDNNPNPPLSPQDVIASIVSTSPRGEIAAQRITDYAASQGLSSADIASALTPNITSKFGLSSPVTADQVAAYTTKTNMSIDPASRIADPTKRLQSLATNASAVGKGDYTEQERAFRIVDEARRQGLNLNQLAGVFGVTPEKVTKVAGRLGVDLAGFANGGEASGGIGAMYDKVRNFFQPSFERNLGQMTAEDIERMTVDQAKNAMTTYERMMREAGQDQEAIQRAQDLYRMETQNVSDDALMKAAEQLRMERNQSGTAPFAMGGVVDDRTAALNSRYGGLGSMSGQMGNMINPDILSSLDRIMDRRRG